ncbi:MAG TPA: FeoA domain-containing protein [Actinomycetota bacterium]|nr:ferrous iron transport protein A [Candidatus Nanopelagicales bacterium]HPE12295.1 FeoA domain-containing protein [Actinomycetota bacterium]HPJ18232.1 FeoA domain-containing protein [Actinomycetota bacterium]HPQ84528.1 FeoA domain-containing protein [Actinomycetota bacterium]HRV66175.1 FeoA domain-containing protein [Candidatus Nanopelagicales bacterium]
MGNTLGQLAGAGTVTEVEGTPSMKRRLAEMGIRTGSHVRVLYRTTGGGRVVSVGGARVALDSGLAAAIGIEHRDD